MHDGKRGRAVRARGGAEAIAKGAWGEGAGREVRAGQPEEALSGVRLKGLSRIQPSESVVRACGTYIFFPC